APEVRTYQTQDGKSGASLSLRVLSIQLLGSRAAEGNGGGAYQPQGGGYSAPAQPMNEPPVASDMADDLPF
ncbi:MAG: single-stranded DNA-binding protein, partial [Lacibacter sp.]|nr:single-stranded DNA-binding protein [Lacibacter sp.]